MTQLPLGDPGQYGKIEKIMCYFSARDPAGPYFPRLSHLSRLCLCSLMVLSRLSSLALCSLSCLFLLFVLSSPWLPWYKSLSCICEPVCFCSPVLTIAYCMGLMEKADLIVDWDQWTFFIVWDRWSWLIKVLECDPPMSSQIGQRSPMSYSPSSSRNSGRMWFFCLPRLCVVRGGGMCCISRVETQLCSKCSI